MNKINIKGSNEKKKKKRSIPGTRSVNESVSTVIEIVDCLAPLVFVNTMSALLSLRHRPTFTWTKISKYEEFHSCKIR
jgi:hypothetical protein